jgi:hypothetical protein
LQGTSASQHRQEAFLEALNDVDQQQMVGAGQQEALRELEARAAQQEAPEELVARRTQQEAPEETEGPSSEEADQPQVTYMLVQF